MTLVSCVIPVYNGEDYLTATLDSIADQTVSDLEVIVADDGSTDGSVALAEAYERLNVKVVRQPNAGASSARNLGTNLGNSEFVAYVDADDLWRPDKIEKQLRAFSQDPKLGACTTHQQNFWEAEFAHEEAENPQLARPQPGAGSTMMLRRSVFDEIGEFDVNIAHRDIQEWMMRAKLAGWKLLILDDVLVDRRIHGNNMSRERITGSEELLDMASQLLARKKGNGAT